MMGDTSAYTRAELGLCRALKTRGGRGVASNGKAAAESASRYALLSKVPRLKTFTKDVGRDLLTPCSHSSSSYVGTGFIGGEDQGYIACP
jgi:hypothetical protein